MKPRQRVYETLRGFLLRCADALKQMGLRFKAPPVASCLYFSHNPDGCGVGSIATHFDDIFGCGEHGALSMAQCRLEPCFGALESEERSFTHLSLEAP